MHAVWNSHPRPKGSRPGPSFNKIWSSLKPSSQDIEVPLTGDNYERLHKYREWLVEQGRGPNNGAEVSG